MEHNGKILVSSCLLGKKCRYNGCHALNIKLVEKLKGKQIIDCCPELMSGLATPRPTCNICGGDGSDVLNGSAKVIGSDGKDYTQKFIEGADLALKKALENKVVKAILMKNSPSCGYGKIYSNNGKKLIKGNGVFAEILKRNGIDIESI